jgi:hypothetical protein
MESRSETITVKLLDTQTGKTAVVDNDSHWYWGEGNGSCDCNRALAFDVDFDDLPNHCIGCHRYLIVEVSTNDIAEFNWHYPADLVRKYVVVPPEHFGETPNADGMMMFTHKELADAYAKIK